MKLEGDIDEVIFDYLEGNLDKEEQEAFDLLKDENETFSHNVRLWQNAYVSEELPSTTELEERCMIESGSVRGVATKGGFIAFIVGLILLVPSSLSEPAMKISPVEGAVEEIPEQQLSSGNIDQTELTVRIKPQEYEQVIHPVTLNETTSELRISDLWITTPVNLESNMIKPLELTLSKSNRTKFSDREIERMKRRQLQRRRAAGFKPGNEPYVVPLNNKNF